MAGSDEIQWLDAEPAAEPDVIHTRGPRWSWWYLLAAAVLIAAIVVAIRPDGSSKSAAPPSPTPSPSSPSGRPSPQPPPNSFTPSIPVTPGPTVSVVGRPLLAVPADWELFARADAAVIRVQLAAGKVTVTPIPLLSSSGSASFVVGPDQALVLSLDTPGGYAVPDGRPSAPLSDNFPLQGPALPGPDPLHIWIPGHPNNTMSLVNFDGTPTGTIVTLPEDVGLMSPDGSGYMLFYGIGGVYDARPTGISRITTGALLASGPTGWLTDECDDQFRCTTTVINRSTGARHTINVAADAYSQPGAMSPDGKYAAIFEGDQSAATTLHLINLASGADRATTMKVDPNQYYQDGLFAWSPDSSWLFATNATGRLYAINARTAAVTEIDAVLGPVSQIALRTSAG